MIREGQIWRDTYDYRTSYARYVKVIASDSSYTQVRTCTSEGGDVQNSRKTRIKTENFTKAYALLKDVQ